MTIPLHKFLHFCVGHGVQGGRFYHNVIEFQLVNDPPAGGVDQKMRLFNPNHAKAVSNARNVIGSVMAASASFLSQDAR